jgi:hypothetical protein
MGNCAGRAWQKWRIFLGIPPNNGAQSGPSLAQRFDEWLGFETSLRTVSIWVE